MSLPGKKGHSMTLETSRYLKEQRLHMSRGEMTRETLSVRLRVARTASGEPSSSDLFAQEMRRPQIASRDCFRIRQSASEDQNMCASNWSYQCSTIWPYAIETVGVSLRFQ